MLSLLCFLTLLLIGLPIAFAMAIAAVLQILLSGEAQVLLISVPQTLFGGVESYGLLALPVFIFLGELLNASGAGRRLIALAALVVGPVRGGLAQVNLIANALMAAVLGSTVAQITLMSRLAVPEMVRAGYSRDMAATITAAGGLLAPVLPPSMLLIVYGVIAQLPIGDLFLAGVVPGLIMLVLFMALTHLMGRRHGFPASARPATGKTRILTGALPALAVPAAMIGAILGGIATPTEAGVVAALAVFVLGRWLWHEIGFADLWPALKATAVSSASILFLIAAAGLYAWVAAWENLPATVAAWLAQVSDNPLVFLLLLNLLLLLLGMVTDPLPALILTVPVLLPVAQDVYGIDPVQFGLITCINLAAGLLTPPVGSGLFTAALLNDVPSGRIARRLLPYLGAVGLLLAALSLWPGLSLGLGRLLG
ncbi:TRAP transporter large permease [Pseudooceanicola sp. CBS1P-1]|uniref:TRAP transporter large permease protein n=1 Tax=Pseudooceanicola albus TaxID=2692189 RepID=A0A6L7G492_9RHOB|nr:MULTISPECIES: TRAP transporter large permease [Pseudooceanicola]MBT9384544.1 TRAP transporter large permease [Pseudooceanicola endophyticus]MXN18246.1 TRAP transporter large permease subunit [Pseudooceanicola albus]